MEESLQRRTVRHPRGWDARGGVGEEVDRGENMLVNAASRNFMVAGRFEHLDERKGEQAADRWMRLQTPLGKIDSAGKAPALLSSLDR